MLTTRRYFIVLGSASAAAVAVAGALSLCRALADSTPRRPHQVSSNAVWRPTPSDSVSLLPHGDWVNCSGEGSSTHCELSDADGAREFEGTFQVLPEPKHITAAQLRPDTSENVAPWMWSASQNRMVPIIHLADGTVLAPRESAPELRSYVARILKFTTETLRPVPVFAAEEQPSASMPDPEHASSQR